MIQYKNRGGYKMASPFPLSAYVIRSYSSEPPDSSKQPNRKVEKMSDSEKQQEQFFGLIKGWGLQKELINNQSSIQPPSNFSVKNVKQELIQQSKFRLQQGEMITRQKKNIYRTRDKKFSIGLRANLSPVKKKHITDNKSVQAFFRYQMVSLLSLMSRKQDFINSLKAKKDLMGTPLKSNEIEEKFLKLLENKGKDKGRQKFNHITNQQLRSLKYKSKQSVNINSNSPKKNKNNNTAQQDDQYQEQQCEYQNRQDNIDLQTWKRRNCVGYYQKVFIIKGGYHDLRKALLERGWYQNEDVWSPHFDFKWTTRICDIWFMDLKNHQAVNHFNNNHHLTSKYGITRRLRTLVLHYGIDVDKFYPRCFDLGDQVDFQNFVQNFKFGFAQTVARRFLVNKERYQKLQLKIRITVDILKRRTLSFYGKVQEINKGSFPVITPEQWQIITETTQMTEEEKEQKLKAYRKKDTFKIEFPVEDPEYEIQLYKIYDDKIRECLQILKKYDPQYEMNGYRNVWIVKPNFMSRGRGIRCFNNLYDIADYCLGRDVQFVAQKYIEHPLLVQGKKFDIRQWVLIQDFNPPKIWFYNECYMRFCGDQFSLDNIYNRQVHLTNNSIQKYNKKIDLSKSMWTMSQFAEYIGVDKWKQVIEKIKNIVVWSIKSCEGHVIGRKGSCQLVGYDFMIDQNYDPWLIEINMSPSMQYSTPVTKKLVKAVLTDTAKVISSNKRNRDTGGFECIYRNNDDINKFDIYKF